MIFFSILITYLVDIVLIMWGEILSWSLKGVKGLTEFFRSLFNPVVLLTSFSFDSLKDCMVDDSEVRKKNGVEPGEKTLLNPESYTY